LEYVALIALIIRSHSADQGQGRKRHHPNAYQRAVAKLFRNYMLTSCNRILWEQGKVRWKAARAVSALIHLVRVVVSRQEKLVRVINHPLLQKQAVSGNYPSSQI